MKTLYDWRESEVLLGSEVAEAVARSRGNGPSRITLMFQARRVSGLHGADPVRGWVWEGAGDGNEVPNAIALRRVQRNARLPAKLRVRSQGDPLQLARILLELPEGKRAVRPDRPARPSLPPTPQEELSLFGTPEYLRAMREAFEALPRSTLTRYRTFFFQLDRRTEPDLVKSSPTEASTLQSKRIVAALRYVRRAIEARTEAQMRACVERPTVAVPFQDPLSFREWVETISDVFLRLLWEHFPDGRGGIDHEGFEEAFEMFATGELRFWLEKQNVFTTEPSSGAFFFFGQFALLAAECGVQPECWTRLANVMVRSQELFCRAYPPAPERPRLADYRAASHAPNQRPTARERADLRARYAGLTLEQLSVAAVRNLAEHAPGEWDALGLSSVLPGISMPGPPESSRGSRRSSSGSSRPKRGRAKEPTKVLVPQSRRRVKGAKRPAQAAKRAGKTRKKSGGRR